MCMYPKTIWIKPYSEITDMEKKINERWTATKHDGILRPTDKITEISWKKITNWKEIKIPCGKCIECQFKNAKNWADRIALEAKNKKCCFITLTYNNENIGNNELSKRDIQLFWKKLRKKIKVPIKYLCCGEHGPKTNRAHYHAIIIGWQPDDLKPYKQNEQKDWIYESKIIYETWGKGFAPVGIGADYESARYVAGYVGKKLGKQGWILCSKGMGKEAYLKKLETPNNLTIPIKTKKGLKITDISRYTRKLWESQDPESYEKWKYKNQKNCEKQNLEILSKTSKNESEYKKMRNEIIKEKARKFGRREKI